MRRRFFGAMLCVLFLPVFGTVRLLWFALCTVAWRPRALLLLGGLTVALSSTDTVSLLAPDGVGPLGHMIPFCVGVLWIIVLWHGLRSRELRVLWRRLR